MPTLVLDASEDIADQVGEFIGRAGGGVVHGRGVVRGGHRRATLKPGLHDAALVVAHGLGTVLVRQMNLDAGDVRREMAQGRLDDAADMGAQSLAAFDGMVGVDLNLHDDDHPSSAPSRLWGEDLPEPLAVNGVTAARC